MSSYELTVVFEADSDVEAARLVDAACEAVCEGVEEGDRHVCRNSFVATGPRRLPDDPACTCRDDGCEDCWLTGSDRDPCDRHDGTCQACALEREPS